MFDNIIRIVEKELKKISDDNNNFHYQECDPEGPSNASKGYKKYKIILDELNQLKRLK